MDKGYNIKMMRMRAGLTQEELGERVGVTGSMIKQIERGTKSMTVELANDMAKVLKCDIRDFVK